PPSYPSSPHHLPALYLPPSSPTPRSSDLSLRRQAQLLHYRPDLSIQILRGNLDTRLRKLEAGEYDGIILAAAGKKRLGWSEYVTDRKSTRLNSSHGSISDAVFGLKKKQRI